MAVLTTDQMIKLLLDAGVPNDALKLPVWLACAEAESSLRTDVVNSIGCVGLFQINQPVHVGAHPTWTTEWLKNPVNNVAAAKVLSSNWTNLDPWKSSRAGRFAKLPGATQAFYDYDPSGGLIGAVSDAAGDVVGDVASSVGDSAGIGAVTGFLGALGNPATWKRVALGAVGMALVVGGLYVVAKPVIKPVAKVATKAATKGAL